MAIDQFKTVDIVITNINEDYIPQQSAVQGERSGRSLTLQITNGGKIEDQSGVSVNLGWSHDSAKNTSGEKLQGLDAFHVVDRTKGIFRLDYPSDMMRPGQITAVIQIISSNTDTRSKPFKIKVEKSPFSDEAAESDNSFTALQEALGTVNQYDGKIDKLDAKKADKKEVSNDISAIESKVNNIANGPKEVFDSYSNLQSKYPSGADGVFLVQDTKHYYIYDKAKSVWVDMGPYQAAELSDSSVEINNISKSVVDFDGFEVVTKKASTVENSTQLWFRADITDKVINNVTLGTEFIVYSEDKNVSYAKTAFFASPSKTSISGGTSGTRHNQVDIKDGFTRYKDSFLSTLTNNLYLHVLVRIAQVDPNKETLFNVTVPTVTLNGASLPLEFVGIHTIGSPVSAYRKIEAVDRSLVTRKVLSDTLEGLVIKKDNEAGYIFFTVSVNQDFENNKGITTEVQDSENYQPVYCVLKLPDNYSPTGNPVPLVMWAHGAGGKVTATDAGELSRAVEYFAPKGYALFDVNGSHNDYTDHADHMGSPRAISAYLKAYEYITKYYNVEPRLFVHGHSMGGLLALNFAAQNMDIVKVLGLVHPVTDMYNQAWLKSWFGKDTKIQMAKEFNFDDLTGTTFEEQKIVGYNPIKNQGLEINSQPYVFAVAPIKIWHGDADNVVSLDGSQKYIAAIKRAGGRATLRTVQGIGHTVTPTMFEEIRMWFDRFKESG